MNLSLALVGNPNVGKTALFNALTGLSLTTGNYPGVTVERRHGTLTLEDTTFEIIDLPGCYSLAARSPDEIIVADILLGQYQEEAIEGIIAVVDASTLERNLYLVSQLLELGKPMIIALNMMDIAARRGIIIDCEILARHVGTPVVPVCAHKGHGIPKLKEDLLRLAQGKIPPPPRHNIAPSSITLAAAEFSRCLSQYSGQLGRYIPSMEAFRILVDVGGHSEQRLIQSLGNEARPFLKRFREQAWDTGSARHFRRRRRRRHHQNPHHSLAVLETQSRYAWVEKVIHASVSQPANPPSPASDVLDKLLTHRVFGSLFFFLIMFLMFEAIYSGALPAMHGIEAIIGRLGELTNQSLPENMFRSLLVDGIISGVGSVLMFLPQIALLSLFIAILEDCGYMSRAAFLMDKLMSWCGLSGHSFIPMLTCFACAVPGILAARTVHDRRDRFTTILVAPLMSCSARLLIYTILIAALVPEKRLFGGFIGLQALTLFAMYLLGIFLAAPIAWLLKKNVLRGETPPFLLEMPSYKRPQPSVVLKKMARECSDFLGRAGTLIFSVTVIIWALAYFPHSEIITQQFDTQRTAITVSMPEGPERDSSLLQLTHQQGSAHLKNSFLGRAGQVIEPVFHPLGWDWRIATAVIACFPAREIFIATLAALLHLESEGDSGSYDVLTEKLRTIQRPDGSPLFTLPVTLSVMVFMALCCQCAATLFTIRRETGQWRWPLLTFSYMTLLAYLGAFLTYHGTLWAL
ncbi:MAG TPA: ferrous iron transport protein B [Candidatus Hydrogenedentes bacterium]|nr:ferrous iron transport protein B [Candidatus Hydrogenedentota bacterium]